MESRPVAGPSGAAQRPLPRDVATRQTQAEVPRQRSNIGSGQSSMPMIDNPAFQPGRSPVGAEPEAPPLPDGDGGELRLSRNDLHAILEGRPAEREVVLKRLIRQALLSGKNLARSFSGSKWIQVTQLGVQVPEPPLASHKFNIQLVLAWDPTEPRDVKVQGPSLREEVVPLSFKDPSETFGFFGILGDEIGYGFTVKLGCPLQDFDAEGADVESGSSNDRERADEAPANRRFHTQEHHLFAQGHGRMQATIPYGDGPVGQTFAWEALPQRIFYLNDSMPPGRRQAVYTRFALETLLSGAVTGALWSTAGGRTSHILGLAAKQIARRINDVYAPPDKVSMVNHWLYGPADINAAIPNDDAPYLGINHYNWLSKPKLEVNVGPTYLDQLQQEIGDNRTRKASIDGKTDQLTAFRRQANTRVLDLQQAFLGRQEEIATTRQAVDRAASEVKSLSDALNRAQSDLTRRLAGGDLPQLEQERLQRRINVLGGKANTASDALQEHRHALLVAEGVLAETTAQINEHLHLARDAHEALEIFQEQARELDDRHRTLQAYLARAHAGRPAQTADR